MKSGLVTLLAVGLWLLILTGLLLMVFWWRFPDLGDPDDPPPSDETIREAFSRNESEINHLHTLLKKNGKVRKITCSYIETENKERLTKRQAIRQGVISKIDLEFLCTVIRRLDLVWITHKDGQTFLLFFKRGISIGGQLKGIFTKDDIKSIVYYVIVENTDGVDDRGKRNKSQAARIGDTNWFIFRESW